MNAKRNIIFVLSSMVYFTACSLQTPPIISPTISITAVDCSLPGRNSPAKVTPECVNNSGHKVNCDSSTIRLWPPYFRPAGPKILPSIRDSTDREAGKTIPGAASGHELFSGIDLVTVNGVSNRLYVAYNAGVQVWDISTNPSNPTRVTYADGWMGHWIRFPAPDEVLSFVGDISATPLPDHGLDLFGAAAEMPVGVSFWEYQYPIGQDPKGLLRQIYQDIGTDAKAIRLLNVEDTIYAFVGAGNGAAIYNVTAARSTDAGIIPDNQGSLYPTVFRGFLPGTENRSRIFIDAILLVGTLGVLISTSGGVFEPLQLWYLGDPNNPDTAIKLFEGLHHTLGTALFEYNDHFYLAVVSEENGLNRELLRIFYLDNCINDIAKCVIGIDAMEDAVIPIDISGFPTGRDFLKFSTVGSNLFLYYSPGTGNLDGPDLEKLFELNTIRPPNGKPLEGLPLVTNGGRSYIDPCNGSEISYWSYLYHSNEPGGLNNMAPRDGVFSEQGHFYRVASSMLDIHKLMPRPPEPPADDIFADGFETGDTLRWDSTE